MAGLPTAPHMDQPGLDAGASRIHERGSRRLCSARQDQSCAGSAHRRRILGRFMSAARLRSWGNHPPFPQKFSSCFWRNELPAQLERVRSERSTTLPFGAGRSYGDSCLAATDYVLHMQPLDRFISADWQSGVLVAEAGVSLEQILAVAIPR